MKICPQCSRPIDRLTERQTSVFKVVQGEADWDDPESSYHCPLCDCEIADMMETAIEFLS